VSSRVLALSCMVAIASSTAGAEAGEAARPVPLIETPRHVLRTCRGSELLAPACPRRVPRVRSPGYSVGLCRIGAAGCAGLTWDDLHIQRGGVVRAVASDGPPAFLHIAVFAGRLTGSHAFRFRYPQAGDRPIPLRDRVFARERSRAVFFGLRTWRGRTGTLTLAPGYPTGGTQGDHLVFRWRRGAVEYAIGLHAWDALTSTEATLRAMVVSLPRQGRS
jgi:hypothetical protein